MENQLIVLKQLPIIEEQLVKAKALVEQETAQAVSLVCTEETYKEVERRRAELNKQLKAFEEQRKRMKAEYMAPYNAFEALYKECITVPYSTADTALKAKIDDVRSGLKQQKEDAVRAYFAECCEANGIDWLTFERAGIPVTMAASKKSLIEKAGVFVEEVAATIQTIETMNNAVEIAVEYKKCLNLAQSIAVVMERRKAIEAEALASEAKQRVEQANAATIAKVEAVVEATKDEFVAPVEVPAEETVVKERLEKVYDTRFKVTGTLAQLKALKAFLEENGLVYEAI